MQVVQDAPLRPSMDIFAVGCVIAELFVEGQPLFELSQLLAYRRGQYDPSQLLEKISDFGIRKMILHMIQLEPELRLSADSYLQEYTAVVFPSYFSPFLLNFYCFWNPLHSDMRIALCQSVFPEMLKQMMSDRSTQDTSIGLGTPSNVRAVSSKSSQDTKCSLEKKVEMGKGLRHAQFELLGDINTLLRDVKESSQCSNTKPMLENNPDFAFCPKLGNVGVQSPGAFRRNDHPFLTKVTMNDLNSLMSKHDSQTDTFSVSFVPLPEDNLRCEDMVLIASLLCSCIRNVKIPDLRRRAILLLKSSALYIDDENRLQRVIPYVVAMLLDPAAIVRCAALETLCDILGLVLDFPPSDAKIFPEYILPMLSMLPEDSEESVRICYASNIAKLALTAYGFLVHSINLSKAGVLDELGSPKLLASSSETSAQLHKVNSDAQLAQLRKSIAEVIHDLVMGPKQTPNIRRALLQDISNLCCFFGQRQSNDVLLPILPAFLNDQDEQLRAVFYGKIVYACFFVGQRSVEEYLLPYIEQGVSDTTEAVIVNAMDCLAILCKSGYLRKRVLLEMIERAFPLLCHPSQWVRRSAVSFIVASSNCLGTVDSYVYLAPVICPLLCIQPASLASEKGLFSCLKPPVSRQVFYQVLENARSSDMLKRQRKIWYNSRPQSKEWDHKGVVELNSMRSWTDDQESPKGQKHAGEAKECDDGKAMCGCMGSFTYSASSTPDIHDPLASEKLQYSGFMWPHGSTESSFMCDKSSVGIPLYSFSMDRRAMGVPSASSDSSLQLSFIGVGASSMPWMDEVNKSLSLASSVPAPKLVSGSFNISTGSKQFYRVVHEPDGRDNDQTAFVNSKFQDMGLSSVTKASSTTMEAASSTTGLTALPSSTRASSVPDSGWRPRGVLVAHLQEHQSAVNDIAVIFALITILNQIHMIRTNIQNS